MNHNKKPNPIRSIPLSVFLNYTVIVLMAATALFFLTILADADGMASIFTGNVVKIDSPMLEVNDFLYDSEYRVFFVVREINQDKQYVARYYPEFGKWQEVRLYVYNGMLFSDKNNNFERYVQKIDLPPVGIVEERYIIMVDKQGNTYYNYI
jgi:hypothetical protein